MGALTKEQRTHYETEGYLLVGGLIPEAVVERAEAAMWRVMAMDPDDVETWNKEPAGAADFQPDKGLTVHNGLQDRDLWTP